MTKHIESDLFWNGIGIAKESADLASKLAKGDYLSVGTDAGLLMDKIIIGTNKFSEDKNLSSAKPLTPEQLNQVVRGFLTSALGYEKMNGLVDCAVTRPFTLEPLVSKCLSELHSTDVADITQGAKDFQTIVDSLLADLNLCESDAAD